MPFRDKTGPQGRGEKTGRQLGDCEGAANTDNSSFQGRGYGRGRGFGRGRRCCDFRFNTNPNSEKEYLLKEKEYIEKRLNELKD